MATRRLFVRESLRSRDAGGTARSRLFDGCCLGAAVAGLVLSAGLGRCGQGRAGATALSTLAPIMQTRSHRLPTGCPAGAKRRSPAPTQ
ncbi:hypothetical protein EJP67_32065 [Variovorax guangxiensis]|uniref:Uncharacterized protein n=1 Tax=Variovorax guangxiensis TaxID=1775474 RepID=A0A433MV73_9BURK|nr:hypothetical protein [Variovorax guangxiensis]RUR71692.1 hypothetical protein EJP67_32065 [Variovorax guangxiensis]